MPESPKIICVTPTCRPESHAQFVKAWEPLFAKHRVTLVTVWDGECPEIEVSRNGKRISTTDWGFPEELDQNRDLFCRYTDACRNLGFVVAAHMNPDFVFTADDDCYPCPDACGADPHGELDPIQSHLDALSRRVPLSWMSTAHDTDLYPRGVPYGVRDEAPAMLSHGVWVGTPDFDGETQLRLESGKRLQCENCGLLSTGDWDREATLLFRCKKCGGAVRECAATGVPHSLPYFVGPVPRGVLFPLCFVPTAEVTMSDGSRTPIGRVNVGDRVFSKGGESHRVLDVIESRHKGDVVKLRVSGRDREVVCTPQHAMWVLRGGKGDPDWSEAKDVTTDDMLATPVLKGDGGLPAPNLSTCKLIGYFLADGCYDKYSPFAPHNNRGKYKGLSFVFGTVGKKEAIRDCCECLENLGVTYNFEHPKESVTVVATNNCYELVSAFRETYYVGEWSDGKRLPRDVFGWDVASKRAILASYSAGDGCFSTIERVKGTTQYQYCAKTRSRTMAVQIQLLMQSLGFPAGVCRLSPYKQSKESWAVTLNGTRAREYNAFLNGGPVPEDGRRKYDKAFCENGFAFYPVKEVSRVRYEGPVYNLTVEDDHSYLVEGLVAKNCGMNVMVKRDALPYLYYAPMGPDSGADDSCPSCHNSGIDNARFNCRTCGGSGLGDGLNRFADIFMGVCLKREFDRLNWACVTGYSTVHHTRASDARKNFEQEKLGREWMEHLSKKYNNYSDIPMTPPDVLDTAFDDYFRSYSDKRTRYADIIHSLLRVKT